MKFTDDELWLIRDALEARIDSNNFYSTNVEGKEDMFDDFLKSETIELFDKMLEDFAK